MRLHYDHYLSPKLHRKAIRCGGLLAQLQFGFDTVCVGSPSAPCIQPSGEAVLLAAESRRTDFPKMDIDGHGPIEQQGRRRVRCLATIELSDIWSGRGFSHSLVQVWRVLDETERQPKLKRPSLWRSRTAMIRKRFIPGKSVPALFSGRKPFVLTEVEQREIETVVAFVCLAT